MPLLVLMRHGQSMWNKKPSNPEKAWKYAGSVDIPLSETGIMEAMAAGKKLRDIPLDVVYCSMLIRAQTTALISLASHNKQQAPLVVRDTDPSHPEKRGLRAHKRKMHKGSHSDVIPMYCSNFLNERDFGDIQGMYSWQQQHHYDASQLQDWRCKWDSSFPNGESSKQVYERTVSFYEKHILPQLNKGKNILIVCHGFVIRTLMKHLMKLTEQQWEDEMIKEVRKEDSILHVRNAEPVIFSYVSPEDKTKEGEFVLANDALDKLLSISTEDCKRSMIKSKL